MEVINQQFRLASRPKGFPTANNWNFTNETMRPIAEDEVLIKVLYISLDPAMRGWMNEGRSYTPPVKIGEVMRALGLGKVIASKHSNFKEGDYVTGLVGVQSFVILNGKDITKIPHQLAPLPLFLNILGMPGMSAYFGLLDTGKPVAGDTVVVSAASGAVGSVVGQIAKIKGCRAVGIVGSDQKAEYIVNELGFDAAINYKTENVKDALKKHCPDGINVYFDNVGGDILDDALSLLAMHARVVICGAISQYNNLSQVKGPSNYFSLLVNRATMQGFLVFDYQDRYTEAAKDLVKWVSEGKIHSREDIVEGIENFPDTFLKLFHGENFGKLILKVANE